MVIPFMLEFISAPQSKTGSSREIKSEAVFTHALHRLIQMTKIGAISKEDGLQVSQF